MAVEIDEAQLAALQKGAALLQKLAADPKAKADFEKAVKAIHPEVRTEADVIEYARAPVIEEMKALREAMETRFKAEDDRRAKEAEDRQELDVNTAFNRLSERGYTDDGLAKIKDLMLSRRIADPEAAALLFDHQNPKPAAEGAHSWEPDYLTNDSASAQGGINVTELMANPEKWSDREVGKVLAELRRGD